MCVAISILLYLLCYVLCKCFRALYLSWCVKMTSHEEDGSLLDQTLYLMSRVYDDPNTPPTPLDIHSACAIGSYQSVQDSIQQGTDFNARNKGESV